MAVKIPLSAVFVLLSLYAVFTSFISLSSLEAELLRNSDSAAFLRSLAANFSAPRNGLVGDGKVASEPAATSRLSPDRRRLLLERRFPLYGTAAFGYVCNYTERAYSVSGCALLARPESWSNEGVSAWASDVASLFLYAAQSRCRLLVDYGPNVSVEEVLMLPHSTSIVTLPRDSETAVNGKAAKVANWTVPRGFECRYEDQCVHANEGRMGNSKTRRSIEGILFKGRNDEQRSLATVPKYRFAYKGLHHVLRRDDFANLTDAMPGFEIETGMACAWNRLFQLAPTAANFRPVLFTKIWPALHDDEAFVIALYIRSQHADKMAFQKASGKAIAEDVTKFNEGHQKVVKCAARLEEKYLMTEGGSDSGGGPTYTKLVWLVVTDSPNLAQHITSTYDTTAVDHTGNVSSILPRRVFSTESRGVHSKPKNQPNTSDFADALIDWYLIGESDVVITHGALSFGSTGALRTARPVYSTSCSQLTLVQEDEGP